MFLAFVVLATAGALAFFIVDQRRRGRFRRAAAPPVIERLTFETSVAAFPAEVVGAAVDDTVGADEVKAILARLMLEKKIASEIVDGVFRLRLLVPRSELARGYESMLIRALFVSGETIDRDTLRKHWTERHAFVPGAEYEVADLPEIFSTQYFDPAAEIAEPLLEAAHRFTSGSWGLPPSEPARAIFSDLTEEKEELLSPAPARNVMAWIYVAILTLGYGTLAESRKYEHSPRDHWLTRDLEIVLGVGLALQLLSMFLAERVRRKPSISILDVAVFGFPMLLLPVVAIVRDMSMGVKFVTAILFAGSMINVVLRARSRTVGLQNEMRHVLVAAREFLEGEVSSRAEIPASWLPHLFAFGLGDRIDPRGEAMNVFQPSGGVAEWNRQVSPLVERFASRVLDTD